MGPVTLHSLPQDVLCNIIKQLGLHEKAWLQLVSKKLYALLLSFPPEEGVWGECHLSDFSNSVNPCGSVKHEVRG